MSDEVASFELSLTNELAKPFNADSRYVKVYFFSTGELMDAFSSDLEGDLGFVQIATFLILFYSILFLGSFDPVYFRSVAAVIGVICVGLAYTSSYGFCSYIGMKVAGVHNLLVFLLLGIGVDDMFVITS